MVDWIGNITPPNLEKIEPITRAFLEERISKLSKNYLLKPQLLLSKSPDPEDKFETLNKYLSTLQPEWVLLNSHQRKILGRFFIGSFAENFLDNSNYPCLILPSSYKFQNVFEKVLFPTSLEDQEKLFFNKIVKGQLGFLPKIFLLSKLFRPVDAFAQSISTAMGGGWVTVESYNQMVLADKEKKAQDWMEEVPKDQKLGWKIDDSTKDFTETVMDSVSKEKIDLVVMPSYATSLEANWLGSYSRELIRNSNLPLYVEKKYT
jgi:nucleotide-binding universal stress UspA family protein